MSGIPFEQRVQALRGSLVEQGTRAVAQVESAFDAMFSLDEASARSVIDGDDAIDREDVRIEREAVVLLAERHAGEGLGGEASEHRRLRSVLTLVKVNNELERIADGAVAIAERTLSLRVAGGSEEAPERVRIDWPSTTRVMTNSVVGIVRDAVTSYARADADLARIVLLSEHAVLEFRRAILRKAEERLVEHRMSIEVAFNLGEVAGICALVADHCTNIAEQVIYETTGRIVRHMDGREIEI